MLTAIVSLSIINFALIGVIIYQQNLLNGQQLSVKEFIDKSVERTKETIKYIEPIKPRSVNEEDVEIILPSEEAEEESKLFFRR